MWLLMGWKTPEESDERKSGESKSVLEVLGVITGSYKCGPHLWSDLLFSHLVVEMFNNGQPDLLQNVQC